MITLSYIEKQRIGKGDKGKAYGLSESKYINEFETNPPFEGI